MRWPAVIIAIAVLGGCRTAPDAKATPSAAPVSSSLAELQGETMPDDAFTLRGVVRTARKTGVSSGVLVVYVSRRPQDADLARCDVTDRRYAVHYDADTAFSPATIEKDEAFPDNLEHVEVQIDGVVRSTRPCILAADTIAAP